MTSNESLVRSHLTGKQVLLGLGLLAAVVAGAGLVTGGVAVTSPSDAPGLAGAGSYNAADADPAHGRSIARQRCEACHGANGNAANPQYPKLAGQNPDYLYVQLQMFITGDRPSPIMSGIAAGLSEADATDVAAYYAAQTRQSDPVKNAALAKEGERIFYARTGQGMMSSCASCHAAGRPHRMRMMGMMGQGMMGMTGSGSTLLIPELNGQHAAYLVDQLNRFASGERPGVMDHIATGLDAADRKAVTAYLAGLH